MNRKSSEIARGIVTMTVLAAFFLVMTVALILPSGANVRAFATRNVYMDSFAFKPQTISIQIGDTVVWTNNDTSLHTTTADGGEWDSGDLGEGDTFSFTFMAQGTYTYHCARHPGMTGTVIVGQVIPEFSSTALALVGMLAVFLALVRIRGKR